MFQLCSRDSGLGIPFFNTWRFEMKYLSVMLFSLLLIGMAGSALAGGPKNDIMHCGCIYVADNETTGTALMVWKQLSIKNGKGHRNHVVNHEDACLSGYDEVLCTEDDIFNEVDGCFTTEDVASYSPTYTPFWRHNNDCLIDGNLNFLDFCDDPETEEDDETPEEGTDCGFDAPLVIIIP
jgi:hypothetical protein